ncbi:MAG: DUF1549 and DUF1553 domain-containing protein [Planctomycetota bacterium]|nr:DUF1549 and DUF1553 domain-containing protein [Planctomycetota bacterium]
MRLSFLRNFTSTIRQRFCLLALVCLMAGLGAERADASDGVVSFRREVLPLLTKLGCNSGPCHGNLTGKGGLRLSLRGEDAQNDWLTLTHDAYGRRVSTSVPEASLLLAKPGGLMPHEGGIKFRNGDSSFRVISQWIVQGATDDPNQAKQLEQLKVTPGQVWVEPGNDKTVRIQVLARWSDGTSTDVTHLSVFDINETSGATISALGEFQADRPGEWVVGVRYLGGHGVSRLVFLEDNPDFVWKEMTERTAFDKAVFNKLKRLRRLPSAEATANVLMRRVYLDLLGVLPTPGEIQAYESDPAPEKYEKLVERLLDRPEFADFWALKWADLLRNEPKVMGSKGNWQFQRWLRDQFSQDVSMKEFARELITTTGSTWSAPASSFHRTNRDPATAAETFAQVFLGYRFQCAKCHNHPSDIWTQNDYYGLAATFANLRRKEINNVRRDRFDKHEVNGDVVVYVQGRAQMVQPRTGLTLDSKPPGGQMLKDDDHGSNSALDHLANWLTSDQNRQFARNLANRVWFHLVGRGVVDPVDDFRDSNPPSNPELLDALENAFIEGGYRLKPLARQIVSSTVYRLGAHPSEKYPATEADFGRSTVRILSAEVLRDIVDQATGYQRPNELAPNGQRAGQLAAANTRGEEFMKVFGKPERLLSCECERSEETTLAQAFQMINGQTVREALESPGNRISRLLEMAGHDPEAAISELFLSALSRRPTTTEVNASRAFLARSMNQRKAWEDLVWATLNAKEFLFRH